MDATRRHFIKTTAPAAMLFQLAGPKPTLKAAGPNDQIALGFIGVGIRGSGHVNTFKAIPGARLVMAADCYDGHLAGAKEATGGKIETTRLPRAAGAARAWNWNGRRRRRYGFGC